MTNQGNSAAELTSEILQLERDIMSAIKGKDTAALEPMLADEFVYRTHFGAEADKAAFLESITSFPVEIISLRGEELKVNVYGDTAVLTRVPSGDARPTGRQTEAKGRRFYGLIFAPRRP